MAKILLGVTGSIAAYKAAELVRLFVKNGDEVKVVMTPAACEFITPLTLQTLSNNPVYVEMFPSIVGEDFSPRRTPETPSSPSLESGYSCPRPQGPVQHISLSDWPDKIVIAPATANTIAKLAYGLADNLLTSTLLAAVGRVAPRPPLFIAPAMNTGMWNAPATQENIAKLKSRGVTFIEPESGFLACGTTGTGRLASVDKICEYVCQ